MVQAQLMADLMRDDKGIVVRAVRMVLYQDLPIASCGYPTFLTVVLCS